MRLQAHGLNVQGEYCCGLGRPETAPTASRELQGSSGPTLHTPASKVSKMSAHLEPITLIATEDPARRCHSHFRKKSLQTGGASSPPAEGRLPNIVTTLGASFPVPRPKPSAMSEVQPVDKVQQNLDEFLFHLKVRGLQAGHERRSPRSVGSGRSHRRVHKPLHNRFASSEILLYNLPMLSPGLSTALRRLTSADPCLLDIHETRHLTRRRDGRHDPVLPVAI